MAGVNTSNVADFDDIIIGSNFDINFYLHSPSKVSLIASEKSGIDEV